VVLSLKKRENKERRFSNLHYQLIIVIRYGKQKL
jgi:hypothetical protein